MYIIGLGNPRLQKCVFVVGGLDDWVDAMVLSGLGAALILWWVIVITTREILDTKEPCGLHIHC